MEFSELKREDKEKITKRYRENILLYINEVIIDPYNKATGSNYFITRQQKEVALATQKLVKDKREGRAQDILGISIMAGKGTGKDALSVWILKWFMFCFPRPKIPCVSVSADQLDKVLWSEINIWHKHAKDKDMFVLQTDKFFRKDVDDNSRGKEWFAFKKAANPKMAINEQVETLQGLHAEYMMQIGDECSGILTPVFEALENNQTGYCNFMFLIFNPMHATGYAVDTQYKNSSRWICFRWDARDSEITNKENIKRIIEDYGEDSNAFRMNVMGLPPLFDEKTLINPDWVMDAVDRPLTILPGTPLVMAVDCGGGGDKSIIAKRRGNKIYPFKRNNSQQSMTLENWIGHEIDTEQPDCVRIDTIGIGWHVEGALRDKKGAIIEAADVRTNADNPERFHNKRAEMYWNLRDCFERGTISIPDDYNFKLQLMSIKYEPDDKGRTKIMEKSKLKKEIGESPDESDACAMLYFKSDNFVSKKIVREYIRYYSKGGFYST